MHTQRLSNAAHARLREYATSRTRELVMLLPMILTPSVKLSDVVDLILDAREVGGVQRPAMVTVVPRSEVGLYLSRPDARAIPRGEANAIPVFVQRSGESHAFLLPIPAELRGPLERGDRDAAALLHAAPRRGARGAHAGRFARGHPRGTLRGLEGGLSEVVCMWCARP